MTSLTWYWRRLSRMSLEEIGHRVQTTTRQWLEWPVHALSQQAVPLSDLFQLSERELTDYLTGPRPVRFLELHTNPPPLDISREETVAAAEDLLAHRFSFFEWDREPLGEPILWNYNYKHRRLSPLVYAPRVNYRDEDLVGDVKYIWELNRHQHFVPLAKAYHLTGDDRYAREVVDQILSWIDQCPYKMGINWTTAEQAAIRLISWIWAYDWIQSASCVTPAFLKEFFQSVYQHVLFITQNYSGHSSANNHLIAESTGVFVATVYFPELKNAAAWRSESQQILIREALQQNHPDGVNCEQATAYQCLVLEYLLLAGLVGQQNGAPFAPRYWRRLERMMEVIAAFMDCRGRVPHIGDSDDGVVVQLGTPPERRARSLLTTGAVLFGRDDFQALAPGFDERTFWFLGTGEPPQKTNSFASCSRRSEAFETGYYVMRSGATTEDEIVSIFDCAPLGYGSLAAHGHADALSLTLTVAGREILIDPGTYIYHSEQTWRDYFRSTAAHNTIRIDEQDQSLIAGNFMWSQKAEAVLDQWKSTEGSDLVSGHHTGYLRLADPVRHRREVTFDKQERVFRIVDTIEAEGEHIIEQFFHFAEDCQIRRTDDGWDIEHDGVRVKFYTDDLLDQSLVLGRDEPPLGWRSHKLGDRQPSPTLVGRMLGRGTCQLVTVISILVAHR